MYTYICIHVCIYIHICIHTYVYTYTSVCVCVCVCVAVNIKCPKRRQSMYKIILDFASLKGSKMFVVNFNAWLALNNI